MSNKQKNGNSSKGSTKVLTYSNVHKTKKPKKIGHYCEVKNPFITQFATDRATYTKQFDEGYHQGHTEVVKNTLGAMIKASGVLAVAGVKGTYRMPV